MHYLTEVMTEELRKLKNRAQKQDVNSQRLSFPQEQKIVGKPKEIVSNMYVHPVLEIKSI